MNYLIAYLITAQLAFCGFAFSVARNVGLFEPLAPGSTDRGHMWIFWTAVVLEITAIVASGFIATRFPEYPLRWLAYGYVHGLASLAMLLTWFRFRFGSR